MNLPTVSVKNLSIVAAMASIAWGIGSALSIAFPDPERFLDYVMFVPFALTLVAITGIHLIQRDQATRLERLGYTVYAIAAGIGLIGQSFVVADIESLHWVAFPVGLLFELTGLILFGIGTVQTKVLPQRIGIAIALSQPGAFAAGLAMTPISPVSDYGDYSGAISHCVAWLVISLALRGVLQEETEVSRLEADAVPVVVAA